jgi:hypothetical protein
MTKRKKTIDTEVLRQDDEGPQLAKAEETLMQYIGPGFVQGTVANKQIEMRLAYCASELGGVLYVDTSNLTYQIVIAHGGSDLLVAGLSLAQAKALCRSVDPSLT